MCPSRWLQRPPGEAPQHHEGQVNRKRILTSIIILAGLALGATVLWGWPGVLRPKPAAGRTAVVRRGTIEASLEALGRVQPQRQIALSTQASGRVARILVQEGQQVAQGELLLELAAEEYQRAIAQAQRLVEARRLRLEEALQAPSGAALNIAKARLRQATAARLKAQSDYDKVAHKPDAESSDEALALEAAKLAYEIAQAEFDRLLEGPSAAELEQLRVELQEAELALQQAQERLEGTRIYAPFAGTVLSIQVQEGENVYGYNPVLRLADLTQWEIRAEIDELDIAEVRPGQAVRIRLDAFPGETLEGTIRRVALGVSEGRGVTSYAAWIDFDPRGLPIRVGMGANLTITTARVEETLLVPRSAVRQIGRNRVVRLWQNGRAQEVVVTTGLANQDEVQILSGLVEGQIIWLD